VVGFTSRKGRLEEVDVIPVDMGNVNVVREFIVVDGDKKFCIDGTIDLIGLSENQECVTNLADVENSVSNLETQTNRG